MAADSLIGGTDTATKLAPTVKATLDNILNDTQGSTIETKDTTSTGGALVVSGKGADNERQTVIVPQAKAPAGTTQSTANVAVDNGGVKVNVALPSNIGLSFEGVDGATDGTGGTNFLTGLVNKNVIDTVTGGTDTAATKLKTALQKAIGTVLKTGDATATTVSVVTPISDKSDTASKNTISISGDTTAGATKTAFALNMNKLNSGDKVQTKGIDKLIVVGNGTVEVDSTDTTNVAVAGDNRAQSIKGGLGNDTISGGGGSDTLSGGGGNNTFGLTGGADTKLTITDFDVTKDKITIDVDGISSVLDIKAGLLNGTIIGTEENGNSHFVFADGTEITLTGVPLSGINASLVDFG